MSHLAELTRVEPKRTLPITTGAARVAKHAAIEKPNVTEFHANALYLGNICQMTARDIHTAQRHAFRLGYRVVILGRQYDGEVGLDCGDVYLVK